MTALGLRSGSRLGFGSKRRRVGTAEPLPESPDQIDSLAFWYDAELSPTIETGGAIERWDDLSGNGNHASQTAGDERPLKVTDGEGRGVLRFDGLDDTLAIAAPPDLAAGVSLFVVLAMRTRSDFSGIISAAAATGVDHEGFFTFQNSSAASGQVQWLGRSAEANPLMIERGDGGSIGLAVLSAGGGNAIFQDLEGQAADTYAGSFGVPDQIILGGHYNDGTFGYAAIDLYEIGLYSRALTVGERSAVYDYLKSKYEL
jgi:hypothetical protein